MLTAGSVQVRSREVQVSRRVGVVQCPYVLAPAADVRRRRGPSQRALRRRFARQVQPTGHGARRRAPPLQETYWRRPRLLRSLARLLRGTAVRL